MSPREKAVELISQSLGIMKADQLDTGIIAASCGVSKAEVVQLIEDLAKPESANGQIRTPFEDRAQILTARGIPVAPVQPKDKVCKLLGWEKLATTNLETVKVWGQGSPDGNTAAVARAESNGFCFFEVDQPNFHEVIQKQTGQKFPETFVVSSSPGRGKGHFYFKQTPASIALQKNVISGKDENGKEAWSFRINNAYVVGPNSVKGTGEVYTIKNPDASIAEIPDWLVAWIAGSKTEDKKTGHAELDDESIVTQGSRNNTLTSVLGRARQVLRMDREELFEYGRSVNQKRLSPPLSEAEVRTISDSIGGYAVKPGSQPGDVLVGGQVAGTAQAKQAAGVAQTIEIPKLVTPGYPVFPRFVMEGCSMYENWVKPFCAANSRLPEYMWMSAVTILLNYLGGKVRVKYKDYPLSIYLLLVGRKGRVIKSSSANDAMKFFELMGFFARGQTSRNGEGKTLMWNVGSTEGLGLEMARTNSKNVLLFYDEMSKLLSKIDIEHSSFASDLATMYESGVFGNQTSHSRNKFQHTDYTASVIACTTDKRYSKLASKLFTAADGMDERWFTLFQPERLPEITPPVNVPLTVENTAVTQRQIEKAIQQSVYEIEDMTPLEDLSKFGNRLEIRAEKFALALAVTLGRDTIDDTCVERARALALYERQVNKYLAVGEAITRDGSLQREMRMVVERNGGEMRLRDFQRKMHYDDMGTTLWYQTFERLTQTGILGVRDGARKDSKIVFTIIPLLSDEEE